MYAIKPRRHIEKKEKEKIMAERLTKKQIDDYRQLCRDRDRGRILTPAGLRFVCAASDYDPEKIGRHFLEVLGRICPAEQKGKAGYNE